MLRNRLNTQNDYSNNKKPNKRINADGKNVRGADEARPVARWLCETLRVNKWIGYHLGVA
jgi:hypothetical protein